MFLNARSIVNKTSELNIMVVDTDPHESWANKDNLESLINDELLKIN